MRELNINLRPNEKVLDEIDFHIQCMDERVTIPQ